MQHPSRAQQGNPASDAAFAQRYDAAIHQRLLDLGVDDFVWKEGEDTFLRMQAVPSPAVEAHCSLILP